MYMNNTSYYKVGGLYFSVDIQMDHPILSNYSPFIVTKEEAKDIIFSLYRIEQLSPILETDAVCHVCDNGTCWHFYYNGTDNHDIVLHLNGNEYRTYRILVKQNWRYIYIDWQILNEFDSLALNNILMLSYVATAARRDRILLHAACIRTLSGDALAFIGHSGAGKSTHARLWMKYVEGCTLMNDDQPVVSVENGLPYLYGTPWSGKTSCYKQEKAPLKMICLMKQASYNQLTSQIGLQAFTTVLAATSMIKEQVEVYKGVVRTLAQVIESIPVVYLENRPEREAVELVWEKYRTVIK